MTAEAVIVVKVGPDTRRAWVVAYLPRGVVTAAACLSELLAKAPVARLELMAETTSSSLGVVTGGAG